MSIDTTCQTRRWHSPDVESGVEDVDLFQLVELCRRELHLVFNTARSMKRNSFNVRIARTRIQTPFFVITFSFVSSPWLGTFVWTVYFFSGHRSTKIWRTHYNRSCHDCMKKGNVNLRGQLAACAEKAFLPSKFLTVCNNLKMSVRLETCA